MIDTLGRLLDSRKFIVALLATITAVLVEVGIPEAETSELVAILSPLLAYIGAQGFADGYYGDSNGEDAE
jgi:hypothetical protein